MEDELPSLPHDVLVMVLEHVPLRERVAACAMVCTAWAAAAAAAPAHLALSLGSVIRWQHAQDWVVLRGQQLTSLSLEHKGGGQQVFHLPCAKLSGLERLTAHYMQLRFQHTTTDGGADSGDDDGSGGGAASSFSVCGHHHGAATAAGGVDAAADAMASMTLAAALPPPAPQQPPAQQQQLLLLPQLQRVELFFCALAVPDFLALGQLQALTTFNLCHTTVLDSSSSGGGGLSSAPALGEEEAGAALSSVLRQLPRLSHLSLVFPQATFDAGLQALRSMQQLHTLQAHLQLSEQGPDSYGECLPGSLSALELHNVDMTPSPAAAAANLGRFGALRRLELWESVLDPCVLFSLPQLQHLVLRSVELVAPSAQQQQQLALLPLLTRPSQSSMRRSSSSNSGMHTSSDTDDEGTDVQAHHHSGADSSISVSGVQGLLAALQSLTMLQHLSLHGIALDECKQTAHQLSALTAASEQLTALTLAADHEAPWPAKAVHRHIMCRPLPRLKRLVLQGGSSGLLQRDRALCADDLHAIARCCPALTQLKLLRGCVAPGASFHPLLSLQTVLRSLSVSGAAFDDAAATVVAQLQGLRCFQASDSSSLTDGGLLQLTDLTALTHLQVKGCRGLSSGLMSSDSVYSTPMLLLEHTAGGAQVRRG